MGLGRFSLFCLEPSLLHFLQEILGDREAEGITYYGVGMAEGTFGSRGIIRQVVCDFGWREDFAAEEIVLYNTQKPKCDNIFILSTSKIEK